MNRIAFIGEGTFIYWSPIILTLSAIAAICFYVAMYIHKNGNTASLWLSIPLSIVIGLPLARLVHWYCQSGAYASFDAAVQDFSHGGFALLGVFIGCMLAALILRLLGISKNMPLMLDCMSIGGGIGIALGRLSSLFSFTDLGKIVPETVNFPFAYGVLNPVSGQVDNRLATFMIQSFVVALIVVLLLAYLFISKVRKHKIPDGDIFLIFLLCYAATQIVLDSTRYDHLVLRLNGFISMVQVFSMIAVLFAIVLFSVRYIKKYQINPRCIALWIGIAAFFGGACYMEYFVQNNQPKALFAYSMMSAFLLGLICLVLLMRYFANLSVQTPTSEAE